MRMMAIVVLGSVALLGLSGGAARGQAGQAGQAGTAGIGAAPGTAAPQAPRAPTDRAAYFPNAAIQDTWKDLEARQIINRRVLEGGAHSINIRIVKEGDAPLVHGRSADVWIVTAGTATAITGGQLVDPQKRPNVDDSAGRSIRNGIEQPLQAGDVLYVPSGVPHGFKDVKGFRAFLVRFDTP